MTKAYFIATQRTEDGTYYWTKDDGWQLGATPRRFATAVLAHSCVDAHAMKGPSAENPTAMHVGPVRIFRRIAD